MPKYMRRTHKHVHTIVQNEKKRTNTCIEYIPVRGNGYALVISSRRVMFTVSSISRGLDEYLKQCRTSRARYAKGRSITRSLLESGRSQQLERRKTRIM